MLTHHPDDATPADGVTFLDCDLAEALRVGLEAAGGKNLEVMSPTIGRQLLELGLTVRDRAIPDDRAIRHGCPGLAIERCADLAEPLCAQPAPVGELVASIPAPRGDHRQHEDPART